MPLSTLDAKAALIVIDLQKGIVAIPTAQPSLEIVDRSARLAAAFREHNLPVALVNVTAPAPGRTDDGPRNFNFPDNWADLVPELQQKPTDILISKQRRGAFIGTSLNQQLRSQGATQVFITGIATSAGVAATAHSASDLGYNVVIVTDAITDRDPEVHAFFVDRLFPRIAETDTTESILKALQQKASAQ